MAEGKNFGQWVLLPLLCRPEAAPLRSFAEAVVEERYYGDTSPWQVFLHDSEDFRERPRSAHLETEEGRREVPFDPELLRFRYPYSRETLLPAKVTATQLKGRTLDEEIAENAAHVPYIRPLSQPKFRRESHGLLPTEKGTATHLVLQYLDFSNFDIPGQVASLRARSLLTEEQAAAVDVKGLQAFLASDVAESIRQGRNVRREYRFTLLMDAKVYDSAAGGEDSILLQGVVDCCFESDEGVTVVDFKTDHVFTDEAIARRVESYRSQLVAYSLALEKVLEKKVVRRLLCFIPAGRTIEV